MSEPEQTSDAQPSNSGDRYHFVYAARRMLDMLHPASNLDLLEMEGVASEDRVFAEGPDTFLGVDLTEYHGGRSAAAASRVVIVQVKYSSIHPRQHWTLARLVRNRTSRNGRDRPGTSVLRKLANAFRAMSRVTGGDAAGRLAVRLHTNQPLDPDLRRNLLHLQQVVRSAASPAAAGRHLDPNTDPLVGRLSAETALSRVQLAAFLLAWDLDGFGQGMLSAAEAELFAEVDRFTDGSVMVGNLVTFVQEHAQTDRLTAITRTQVYNLLRLREEDFFPAPTPPDDPRSLFLTSDSQVLLERMGQEAGTFLLVEGRGGSGKSSALRVAARVYGGGGATILYDCFAGGAGLSAGSERFPYTVCFAQIINELDAKFRTGVLATTRLPYATLMRRFVEALTAAASIVAARGHRLVIALDAVDNAVDVAARSPVRTAESFVPLLWRIAWPANCLVLLSSRTENVHRLGLAAPIPSVEMTGFTQAETERHVRALLPPALEEIPGLVPALQQGTRGNPRVQAAVLEDIAVRGVDDPLQFVRERARASAFEYYRDECPRRVDLRTDRLLLAVLREATQLVPLATLADMLGRARDEVEVVVLDLSFGLRLTDHGDITWRDQEFLDFLNDFVADEQSAARELLAEYCLAKHRHSEYARRNLARHLHMAGRHEELLRWCLEEGRLEDRIREVEPHGEDVLQDIEYALLSAAALQRAPEALSLLALAAEIVQGRDLFVEKLWSALPAAVASGYLGRLLDDLAQDAGDPDTARLQIHLAGALAAAGKEVDVARDLLERGLSTLSLELAREEPRIGFDDDDSVALAIAHRYLNGFRGALDDLSQWEPRDEVGPYYAPLARSWAAADEPHPVAVIRQAVPEATGRAYAFAGFLSCDGPLPRQMAEDAVSELLSMEEAGHLPMSERRSALLGLLRSGYADLARRLLPTYHPDPPSYSFDQEIDDFLLERALSVALGQDTFDPSRFPEVPQNRSGRENDNERELRSLVSRHYPTRLALARALAGAPAAEVRSEIELAIRAWKGDFYYPGRDPYTTATEPGDILARAIVAMEGYHPDLVQRLLRTTEKLAGEPLPAFARYAAIFASEAKYHADAERLILEIRRDYRPPRSRAEDSVELFLTLHGAAMKFDPDLATSLFVDARLIATELDAEIPGRSFSLYRTLRASRVEGVPDAELVDLVGVYRYMGQAEGRDTSVPLRGLLRLLARTRPSVAFWAAADWEGEDVLWVRNAVASVAQGLLDAEQTDGRGVWPLLDLASSWTEATQLFRRSIDRMRAAGHDPAEALAAYGKFARARVARESRPRAAREMVEWAEQVGLGGHPGVARVREYGAVLSRLGVGEREQRYSGPSYAREVPALCTSVLEALVRSPAEAAALLESAPDRELAELSGEDVAELMAELRPRLPSARLASLLSVLERWDALQDYSGAADIVLDLVGATPPDHLVAAARPVIERLLTPHTIAHLAAWHSLERKGAGLRHPLFGDPSGFAVLLGAAARHLRALSAESLHRWIGLLSELLSPSDAGVLFGTLLGRARSRLPVPLSPPPELPWEDSSPQVRFLCDLLGHPKVEMRWHGIYVLADLCLFGPEDILDAVVGQFQDESHPRWMTRREWLAFLLEHLALRQPEKLVPHAEVLFSAATDHAFPHAKIRHHLREALLRVEAVRHGTLSAAEVERVRSLNQPGAFCPERWQSGDHEESAPAWDHDVSRPFNFDDTDTIPYWYHPLNNCFAAPPRGVEEIAYEWIVDRWGVTDDLCLNDDRDRRFDWTETGHSHGSQPSVEVLRTYVERHAMYLAAGTLVETAEVVFRSEREGDEWTEWVRDELRLADPAVPGRWVDGPPPLAENYGKFGSEYEEWRRKGNEAEFRAELNPEGATGWIVVAGHRAGAFGERRFTTRVWSALVSPGPAEALRRAVSAGDVMPALPRVHLSPDVIWPEYEHDLEQRSNYYVYTEDEVDEPEAGFELRCWLADLRQEFGFESADPRHGGSARTWAAFTTDVPRTLGLVREPASHVWNDSSGNPGAYVEVWYDATDRSSSLDIAEGYRVVLRADLAAEYARRRGMDILLLVERARNRSYRHRERTGEKEAYDRGTRRVFLFNAEGRIR